MYRKFFKRMIDIIASICALVVLSPLFSVCFVAIYLQDFSPVIFVQKRIGKNGRIFNFYKFRSMPVNTPNVESSETTILNVTSFGKFIRRTNIDELPQLVNVIKGDMSLIGPRPPIPTQHNLIALRRDNGSLKCKPGLSGLAQVNSYDFMPETEKAKLDGIYAQSISFVNDLSIIIKTLGYMTKKPPTY